MLYTSQTLDFASYPLENSVTWDYRRHLQLKTARLCMVLTLSLKGPGQAPDYIIYPTKSQWNTYSMHMQHQTSKPGTGDLAMLITLPSSAWLKKKLVTGMPTNLSNLPPLCDHCILGKQTRTPVPKVREGGRATRRLEKVFSDITGPEDTQTAYGGLYMLNFIDDFSQKTWVYILKRKSDTFECFKEWQALVTRETNLMVNIFRTDNGGEYTSKTF